MYTALQGFHVVLIIILGSCTLITATNSAHNMYSDPKILKTNDNLYLVCILRHPEIISSQ